MQVAHPLIARGVAEHSSYRRDRVARLLGTLRPMDACAFGTPEEARRAGLAVRGAQRGVAGAGYTANDAELMRWMLATLVDTALVMHRRFVGPVDAGTGEGYYREMCGLGEWVGLPASEMPGTLAAFHEYVDRSEEHTSELQSLMRISYAVFCLKKKTHKTLQNTLTP